MCMASTEHSDSTFFPLPYHYQVNVNMVMVKVIHNNNFTCQLGQVGRVGQWLNETGERRQRGVCMFYYTKKSFSKW